VYAGIGSARGDDPDLAPENRRERRLAGSLDRAAIGLALPPPVRGAVVLQDGFRSLHLSLKLRHPHARAPPSRRAR
jgi:hypothetical protein